MDIAAGDELDTSGLDQTMEHASKTQVPTRFREHSLWLPEKYRTWQVLNAP